jgi:hypothetical protein
MEEEKKKASATQIVKEIKKADPPEVYSKREDQDCFGRNS